MFDDKIIEKNWIFGCAIFWLPDLEKFRVHAYLSKVATRSNASIRFKFGL